MLLLSLQLMHSSGPITAVCHEAAFATRQFIVLSTCITIAVFSFPLPRVTGSGTRLDHSSLPQIAARKQALALVVTPALPVRQQDVPALLGGQVKVTSGTGKKPVCFLQVSLSITVNHLIRYDSVWCRQARSMSYRRHPHLQLS